MNDFTTMTGTLLIDQATQLADFAERVDVASILEGVGIMPWLPQAERDIARHAFRP